MSPPNTQTETRLLIRPPDDNPLVPIEFGNPVPIRGTIISTPHLKDATVPTPLRPVVSSFESRESRDISQMIRAGVLSRDEWRFLRA